jgi:Phage capsid family.
MPANGLAEAPGGFLLGLPIRFSEFASTVGDLGDIQLISPRGYYGVRRAEGVRFASSIHLYFDYATEAFRWTFRYGGQPHLSAPVSPANGSATKSHFVTLAARA